jgi:hypothetical protein
MEIVYVVKRIEQGKVSVRCPYCMEGHLHKERDDEQMLGVRWAACNRGYYILEERPIRKRETIRSQDRR